METFFSEGVMGQIRWTRKGEGWEVRHFEDQDATGPLRGLTTLGELEELVRWDSHGIYRPLRTEGNLAAGWHYFARGGAELREVLEVIYPGMWGNAQAWKNGKLKFQTWEEALAKQTERVRNKAAKAGDLPRRVVEENCQKRCLKTVLWAGERGRDKTRANPMLCTGPCGVFWGCVES